MKRVLTFFMILFLLVSCTEKISNKDSVKLIEKEREKVSKRDEEEFERVFVIYKNDFKDLKTDDREDKFYLLSNHVSKTIVEEAIKNADILIKKDSFKLSNDNDLSIGSPFSLNDNLIIFPVFQNNKIVGRFLVVIKEGMLEYCTSKLDDEFLNKLLDKKGIYELSYLERIEGSKPYPKFELVNRDSIKDKEIIDITKSIHIIKLK